MFNPRQQLALAHRKRQLMRQYIRQNTIIYTPAYKRGIDRVNQ